MKTLKEISQQASQCNNETGKEIDMLIKITALVVFFILNVTGAFSQERFNKMHYGIGVENFSSANGHGCFYSPSFNINNRRSQLGLGVMVQKRSASATGLKLSYQYNLTAEPVSYRRTDFIPDREIFQVNLFGYLQYNKGTSLSYNTVYAETMKNGREGTNWNSVKLSTAEIGSGFRLQINATNSLNFQASAGASFYYHTSYITGMNHERFGPGLFLGLGMNIVLK